MNTSTINPKNKKIIVGLSGGVDSTVAMTLLKDQGAIVEALHMTNWNDDDGYCNAAEDLQDAKKVCKQLSIPLHHVNFSKEYKEYVFKYFLDEYKIGRTPNPDILCNREIKFGVFKNYAHRLGSDYIATGHYAKIQRTSKGLNLIKPKDKNKDQTYFLHAVDTEAFENTIFPLSDLSKKEVREFARNRGLLNFNKKDSTGICFIGERPFRDFLKKYIPTKPGSIVDTNQKKVGTHQGLMFYTIGQRQGLNIGGLKKGNGKPWYVLEKKLSSNTLVVAQGDHPDLYKSKIVVSDTSWIGINATDLINQKQSFQCHAKIRYRQADQECTVNIINKNKIKIIFTKPQKALALGQAAVLYKNDVCLGGGFINEIKR